MEGRRGGLSGHKQLSDHVPQPGAGLCTAFECGRGDSRRKGILGYRPAAERFGGGFDLSDHMLCGR